jgi:hypothetical protein
MDLDLTLLDLAERRLAKVGRSESAGGAGPPALVET